MPWLKALSFNLSILWFLSTDVQRAFCRLVKWYFESSQFISQICELQYRDFSFLNWDKTLLEIVADTSKKDVF